MVVIILLIAALAYPAASAAEIHKYVDKDGVVWFSNLYPTGEGTTSARLKDRRSNSTDVDHRRVRYHAIVNRTATEYSLDPSLVKAVISVESNWNASAVSRKGAIGLMQIMPATADALGVKDPYDPEENIRAGTRYLRHMLERFNGNLALALAAYNAGPATVERFGRIPPIKETEAYVKKVLFHSGYDRTLATSWQYRRGAGGIKAIRKADGSVLYTNMY